MRSAQLILTLASIAGTCLAQQMPQPNNPQDNDQDQPGQPVARLSILNGEASVRRGDSVEWVAAVLNAPLMAGDSVSVAPGGRAELQLDYANFIRIGGETEIRLADLGSGHNRIQVARGLVTYRTLRDSNIESEISTPAAAVHPLRMSSVRVEVSPDAATRITVRRGEAEASSARGTEQIREGGMMLLRGPADNPDYQIVAAAQHDAWDGFNDQRDSFLEHAQSSRYVSPDVSGAEDLDAYGRWGYDQEYGNVWTPAVAPGWAPYREGQWVWEDPYGWTWVDSEPWGWAPFHYGSWYYRASYGWSWFPGQRFGHYWWHPAMVGFIGFGGGGVGFGFGNIGWIPLAPYEVFHPWYGRGAGGYGRFGAASSVNIARNTVIVNSYRNAGVGATSISVADFQRGQFRNRSPVNREQLLQASVVRGAVPITPGVNSMRFSNRQPSAAAPRNDLSGQRFFSRTAAGSPAIQRSPATQAVSPGWQRFGEPGPGASRFVSPAPSGANNGSWDRFGSPQGTRPQAPQIRQAPQQSQAPQQFSRPVYDGSSRSGAPSRSIQVAPPIVRQREAAPAYRSAPQSRSGGFPSAGSHSSGARSSASGNSRH